MRADSEDGQLALIGVSWRLAFEMLNPRTGGGETVMVSEILVGLYITGFRFSWKNTSVARLGFSWSTSGLF